VLHGASPFVDEIGGGGALDDAALGSFAHAYLEALNEVLKRYGGSGLGLPDGWLDALDPDLAGQSPLPLRWLDIWPPLTDDGIDGDRPPRLASWLLDRHAEPGEPDRLASATVIMVAADEIPTAKMPHILGLDFGLRVPVTVTGRDGGGYTATIRSMTAELPYRPYRSLTEVIAIRREAKVVPVDPVASYLDQLDSSISANDSTLAERLQLTNLVYDDLRLRWRDVDNVPEFEGVELLGKGIGLHHALPHAFAVDLVPGPLGDEEVELVQAGASKHLLASHAHEHGMADIFDPEPPTPGDAGECDGPAPRLDWSSWQATRDEEQLERFRRPSKIGDQEPVPLATADFKIRNCPFFVPEDRDVLDPKTVSLPAGRSLPVRSNDFSAISAYVNCRRFFEIIAGFGISLDTFVVAAERELQVFYRSGMGTEDPDKNGETINARVVIEPSMPGKEGFRNALLRPTIAMHLALGNLTRRSRRIDGILTPARAEPLGIAASGRWMWHEFGHVLVAARLGQLEFDFAHSPGDGMAAVMADPFSPLADPRDEIGKRFRGLTYPWVFTTRRHDRSVTLGWAWGGALNRSLLAAPARQRAKPKGYLTEQILSSTLFRLYRVLGGDTVWADGSPNCALRERASFVTLYLLVQAVWSMAQPPSIAEMLEEAMEWADMRRTAPLPFAPLNPRGPLKDDASDAWIGGCAHKVVRWAFEAQGMFAPGSAIDHNAPGRPMAVDIYIADQRPRAEAAGGGTVHHRPGGYVPVSLDWDGARLWQADPVAILARVPLTVGLRNRGDEEAVAVRLRAWWGRASGDPASPGWDMEDAITWLVATGAIDPGVTVPPGAGGDAVAEIGEVVDDSPAAPGTFWLLLVEVSCPDDRANSDPAAMLPTAIADDIDPPTVPRLLADLVANDNNLALWQF
jgi:hypothetical protein